MALIDTLISYWKMDDASGAIADAHSTNPGTNSGAAYGTAGKINTCLDFESTENDKVTVTSVAALNPANCSISLWLKPESAPNNSAYFAKGTSGSDILQFGFYSTTLRPMMHIAAVTGGYQYCLCDVGDALSAGNWYHLVATWDGTTQKIYINGIEKKTRTGVSGNYVGTAANLKFGEDIGTENYDGLMDEVAFFFSDIGQAGVTALYNSGNGLAYPFTTGPDFTKLQINIGDVWKAGAGMQINIGDAWKNVAGAQINIGDAWKKIF